MIDFVHPDDRQANIDILQRLAISPEQAQHAELRFISPTGDVRRVELRATAQKDANGQFGGASSCHQR